MTCPGYRCACNEAYRVHCNGCAEAEKLRDALRHALQCSGSPDDCDDCRDAKALAALPVKP